MAGVAVGTISVIVPSYNSAGTIERCLLSVLHTGYQPLEVIVVDDASTDGSTAIVERLCRTYPAVVRLVRQPTNGGPAKARNAGARVATGDYYFFLDSDTEMQPDALRNFARSIDGVDAAVGIYDAVPLNGGAVPLYKALLNHYFFSRRGIIEYEVFDSARAGIRASVFHGVGGFQEDLGWGMDYENEELGYRLCKRHRVILDPSIAVRHVFPGWWQLSRTYFFRVALWAEIFAVRRQFESGGVTSSGTGLSTASLLLAATLLPLAFLPLSPEWRLVVALGAGLLFCVYFYGYAGFFKFVVKRKPMFALPALLLNIYFTLVIAMGACFGLLKVLVGRSSVKLHAAGAESRQKEGHSW